MPSSGLPAPDQAWLLTGAHDGAGQPMQLLVVDGKIAKEAPAGPPVVSNWDGWALLPAAAEAHAHLDKAFLGCSGGDGDLREAIRAMQGLHPQMTTEAIARRARSALHLAVRHGFTSVRSHVDVGGAVGTRGVEALALLRDELRDVLQLQLVALPVVPVTGRDGAAGRRWLSLALGAGADVVGGAPWLDAEPLTAIDVLTSVAAEAGAPIDLHMDETTNPDVLTLGHFARRVDDSGLGGRATASHCVSLGQQPPERASAIARDLAGAGVAVVVLPQTNLYLQGRTGPTRVPRALPPLGLLGQCGVRVGAGGDNWRDPFNPLGRVDPMETAALLVAAGHVGPGQAYAMVSETARDIMGLPPAALRPGEAADFLAMRAPDLASAIAGATEERAVAHRGRLVSRTELHWEGLLRSLATDAQKP